MIEHHDPMQVTKLAGQVFQKYSDRGAYHWDMISRNPRKHHPFVAARYQICLELLGTVTGKKVLDLGCGDGALAGLLVKAGGEVVGVDPNQVALGLARQQFSRHGLRAEFYTETSNLPSSYFDAAVCTEVIEHVVDPRNVLEELRRMLKPGGIAVVSTPIRLTEKPLDQEHVREYFPWEFHRLCAAYFEVLEVRQEIPVGLHEILHITGMTGRLVNLGFRMLSCWFKWNYLLKLRGSYRVYEIQFAKLKRS